MPATHGHGNPDWTRDETILALALLVSKDMKCPSKSSPETVALSKFLRSCSIHPPESRKPTFRNQDSVYMKMQNLLSCDRSTERKGLVTTKMDRAVWAEFHLRWGNALAEAQRIRATLETIDLLQESEKTEEDPGEAEGDLSSRLHRRRERARGLRKRAIAKARQSGLLSCEACRRQERALIGSSAEAEFEVHHRMPLSTCGSESRRTKVSDLAILCANCHRLIHALMRERRTHLSVADFAVEVLAQR
jgi:5-methylcytosine-specific restriction protein A